MLRSRFRFQVEKWRCHLRLITDGFGVQLNVQEQINAGSKYIRIVQNEDQPEFVNNPDKQLVNTFDAGGDAGKMGSLGIDKLSAGDQGELKKYLIAHAADSDQPAVAGK